MSFEARIRAAKAGDAELLPEIERSSGEAFRAVPDLAWIADDDVMSAAQHAPHIAAGGVWVAERDARLVGFISTEAFPDAWHIWQMALSSDQQKLGLGRALLEEVIEAARVRGASVVTLTTFRDVAFNAPFYARSGFRILAAHELNERLQGVLANEIAQGLPGESRCAMRLEL